MLFLDNEELKDHMNISMKNNLKSDDVDNLNMKPLTRKEDRMKLAHGSSVFDLHDS